MKLPYHIILNNTSAQFGHLSFCNFLDIDAIAFNTSSTSIVLNETSSFFVECTANSNPAAAYSWTKKAGSLVSSTSVLSISSVNRNQNGTYTCIATNNAGLTVSKSLTLDVHCEYSLLISFFVKINYNLDKGLLYLS